MGNCNFKADKEKDNVAGKYLLLLFVNKQLID